MPITVTCTCGKALRTADENLGKRIRCPACRQLVTVKNAAAGIAPPIGKRERGGGSSRVPSFTLSPLYIATLAAAILIPALLLWVREGPMKAERQWSGMTLAAEDRIQTIVLRAMNVQYAAMGINPNDPDGVHPNPKVSDFNFDEPVMMLSLPGVGHVHRAHHRGHGAGNVSPAHDEVRM